MAQLAGRGEAHGDVVDGALGVVVIRLMTTDARRIRQLVIVVHVAVGALPRRNRVRSRQGKAGLRVIESRTQP